MFLPRKEHLVALKQIMLHFCEYTIFSFLGDIPRGYIYTQYARSYNFMQLLSICY